MDSTLDVRRKIKHIILDKALKQATIAKRAKLEPSQMCSIIKCRRKLEAHEFIRICEAMGMTCDEVINYEEE